MLPAANHDVLVIADSDLHAAPDWLDRIVATLQQDGVGLATTPYVGLAGVPGWVARLGAMQISHAFLPGALLARALGRQDCLGATMALRREVLERIGGFAALQDELADDAVLGQLVAREGLRVALVPSMPATTVGETTLGALWRHELRWSRTVRSLAPAGHAASVVQYPLGWAALTVLASGLAPWAVAGFLAVWLGRAELARRADQTIIRFGGLASQPAYRLLPLRDLLSIGLVVASFAGTRVEWRGQTMRAAPVRLAPGP
jgi:ceramide glucosyltransferase